MLLSVALSFYSFVGFLSFFFFQFVNSKVACIIEETIVDPVAQTFTSYTRNISFQRLMVLEEKCVYRVSSESKDWYVERLSFIHGLGLMVLYHSFSLANLHIYYLAFAKGGPSLKIRTFFYFLGGRDGGWLDLFT